MYFGNAELVWQDYGRELFELWYGKSLFDLEEESTWNARFRCWRGVDKSENKDILLFCPQDDVDPSWNENVGRFLEFESHADLKIFFLYKANDPLAGTTAKFPYKSLSLDYILRNLVDFTDYYNEIRRRVDKEPHPESNVTVKDIYTPSSLTTLDDAPVSDDLGRYLSTWAAQPPYRQIAILGEYGQGKSTGTLMFTYEAIESNFATSGNRIPILLELRGKSPSNLLPSELLGTWAQRYKLHAEALMKLLIAGRLILIFEGFDEMANVSNVEARIAHFRSLWQFAYPASKIIFTGRPNLFFEDRELEIVFKAHEGGGATAACDVLRLAPFNLPKIEQSLRWTDPDTRTEILTAATASTQILDIVARPSLLHIVAALWTELRPLLRAGKVMSAQVIDRFIAHSYTRQENKEKELQFMVLTSTERRYFHEGIAVFMASKGATNQIMRIDLEAAIRKLYKSYPELHILDVVIMESSEQPLKKRLSDEPEEAIEAITTDVRTYGILVDDPARPGAFRFAHKSFYELLYAKCYACVLLDVEPSFYRAIRDALDGDMGEVKQSGLIPSVS